MKRAAYATGDDRWDQVATAVGIGGAAGLGLAGIAGIIREIGLQRAHDKVMRNAETTDDNTIILTIPRRKTPALKQACEKVGIFFDKEDAVTAPSYRSYVLRSAAIPVSALAAYVLADKLHSANIKKRLKREEDEARSEFIGRLGAKQAEDMDWVLYGDGDGDGGLSKSGQSRGLSNRGMNIINAILGPLGILTLLGAGGTAYITKRVMDAKDDAKSNEGWDPPKIKRVVVRSAPLAVDSAEEKVASAQDIDGVRAALAVTMSALSGRSLGVLDSPAAKQALADAGISKSALYAMAEKRGAGEGEGLAGLLTGNAKLRSAVLDQAPKVHPILGSLTWNDEGAAPNPILPQLLKALPDHMTDKMMRAPLATASQKYYDDASMWQRFKMRRALANPGKFNKNVINDPKLLASLTSNIAAQAGPATGRSINLKPIAMKALPLLAGAAATTITPKGLKWLPMAAGAAGTGYLTRKDWMPVVDNAKSKIKEYASPGATLAKGSKKEGRLMPSVSGITSNLIGNMVTGRGDEETHERGAEVAGKQIAMLPTSSLNSVASRIRVEADPGDEEAQAFLDRRRAKINAVLKQLLAEGELRAI